MFADRGHGKRSQNAADRVADALDEEFPVVVGAWPVVHAVDGCGEQAFRLCGRWHTRRSEALGEVTARPVPPGPQEGQQAQQPSGGLQYVRQIVRNSGQNLTGWVRSVAVMSEEITPFRIDIPEADLDHLRDRLDNTRRDFYRGLV
jgi:hypothetical protein